MTITIANKSLTNKPSTQEEKSKYFYNLAFKSGSAKLSTFQKVIENGFTITYQFADKTFVRNAAYMKNNYRGTDYIVVDIDKCDLSPVEFVERIKYKPTIWHTTFSNLTENKDNKYCFHLIYVFSSKIEGEDAFNNYFEAITADYAEYVDNCAKDCHRVIFTTNKNLPNYEADYSGKVLNIDDIKIETLEDSFDEYFEDEDLGNNLSFTYITPTININENQEISQQREILKKNEFSLNDEFFEDLNSMQRGDFIAKWSLTYTYQTQTEISYDLFEDGWADLRDIDYYEVPTAKYRYNPHTNKKEITKIEIGNRTTMLFQDAIAFMKVIPNITKEWLVYCLITEVFQHFKNNDGEMTNYKIISTAKCVWNNMDEYTFKPTPKTFKIQKGNVRWEGMKMNEIIGTVRKALKDKEIGEVIDLDSTLEDNIKLLTDNGVKITKKRLQEFCDTNGITLNSTKDNRNTIVINFYKENNSRSSRDIEKLCREIGLKVSYKTIQTILNEYKLLGKN